MEKDFEIRTYGVSELAQLYNPNVHPNSAVRILRSWIDRHPTLRKQLTDLGLRPFIKTFTPMMVQIIVEAIGEP